MPSSRKGSKVAASQARAKEAAKKKARQSGPTLPAAAYVTPPPDAEETTEEVQPEAARPASIAAPPRRPQGTLTRPQAIRAIGMRRERHAAPALAGPSLKRELGMIGALTAITGIALAVLKLATDLGA